MDEEDQRDRLLLARRVSELKGSTKGLFHESHRSAFKNLVYLSLYGNRLTDITGISILKNSPLEELNLGWNKLTTLPEEFSELQQVATLKSVWLDDNQLSSIPGPLFSLQGIAHLRLSGNQIKALPDKIAQWTGLETFACDNNELEELPASIGKLTSLKALVLRGNALKRLPDEMRMLKNLEVLQCSSNKLEELPDVFGGLPSLKQLFGGSNAVHAVPHSLAMLPSSVEISLVHNDIATLDPDVASRWLDEEGKPKSNIKLKGNKCLRGTRGLSATSPSPQKKVRRVSP